MCDGCQKIEHSVAKSLSSTSFKAISLTLHHQFGMQQFYRIIGLLRLILQSQTLKVLLPPMCSSLLEALKRTLAIISNSANYAGHETPIGYHPCINQCSEKVFHRLNMYYR